MQRFPRSLCCEVVEDAVEVAVEDALPARLAIDLDRAFEELVRVHQHLVFGVALRVTNDRSDAEDIAQETFIRAYRALGAYDGERVGAMRLRPWLARIALNLARNRVSRRRRAEPLEHHPAAATASASVEADFGAAADAQATALLLRQLPDRYRVAVALRHVEGLSYAELAEVLGRPVGTVKAQVHRGLDMLRTALEKEDAR